jgi:threonine/homoserine/homoserine lactone efflux protein
MTLLLPFFLGFLIAAIGIVPPGLINMTVAKVSLKNGKKEAVFFALGATLIIFIQSFIALLFANYINSNPDIINSLQEIGLLIFVILTVYFFWKAKVNKVKKEEIKVQSKTKSFFLGMLLAALNLFPIPYYVFVSVTLAAYGYFNFNPIFIYPFVVGVASGSFFVFILYVQFFKKRKAKSTFLLQNGNYIIGSITGLISIITLYKIVKIYFI